MMTAMTTPNTTALSEPFTSASREHGRLRVLRLAGLGLSGRLRHGLLRLGVGDLIAGGRGLRPRGHRWRRRRGVRGRDRIERHDDVELRRVLAGLAIRGV